MELIANAPVLVRLLGGVGLLLLASGLWTLVGRRLAQPRLLRVTGRVVRYEESDGRAWMGGIRFRNWRPVIEYRLEQDDLPRYFTAGWWSARKPFAADSEVPVVYDPLEAVEPVIDHPRGRWSAPLATCLAGLLLLLAAAWLFTARR